MKIGAVDPEFSLLRCLFLKEKEEINASRTYSPLRMHAAQSKKQVVQKKRPVDSGDEAIACVAASLIAMAAASAAAVGMLGIRKCSTIIYHLKNTVIPVHRGIS